MRNPHQRRQCERAARAVEPARIGIGGAAHGFEMPRRASHPDIGDNQLRMIVQQLRRHARTRRVVVAGDVAAIGEVEPAPDQLRLRRLRLLRHGARFDNSAQIGP
jgi:hypothetical protein